jgi:hypothetical protein
MDRGSVADSSQIGLTHTVKVFMTTISLSAIASACAASLVEAKGHDDKSAACKETANKSIVQLNAAGAVVGDKRVCSIAFSFHDGLVTGGWAKRTADNYLSTFRKAVASGKPVTDWNPNRKDAKAKASAKGKAKGKKEFADKLAMCFRDADFEGFIADLEASYKDDAIENLMEGVKSFLEASGVEL